jgi:uncharacterized Ntn-hydrolase superfamily protein
VSACAPVDNHWNAYLKYLTNKCKRPQRLACLWLTFGFVLVFPAHATWSIVAVDPETGEAGLAAATCGLGISFIAEAVPGAGVVAAQASTSFKGRDQARAWLADGLAASEILARLSNPAFYDGWFDRSFADLQYGVAALSGIPRAGFTGGDDLVPWAGGTSGTNYSVQGNTLRGETVITAAANAFESYEQDTCRPSLGVQLLRALEAGRDAGGDRRCPANAPAQSAILYIVGTSGTGRDQAATTLRIVTPMEIGIARGIYYSIFPYEPAENSVEPVQQLREKYLAAGGRNCQIQAD